MTTEIVMPIELRNPGAYLAACGVVEIAAAFDPTSVSHWEPKPVVMGEEEIPAGACIIQTGIAECDLVAALLDALSNRERWEVIALDGRHYRLDAIGRDEALSALSLFIRLHGRQQRFTIDYWYHWLPRADDEKVRARLPKGKSAWKFWSGRMSLQKTLLGESKKPGLIAALGACKGEPVGSITCLLSIERDTGSSLNLDAAARRGALDRGIAANEAKRARGDVAAVRPALELLAAIGLSAFFPPRRLGGTPDNGIHGTAGFNRERLCYCSWAAPSPLALARLLARGVRVPGIRISDAFEARRVGAGGKIYRFDYARGMGSRPVSRTQFEEEFDVGEDTSAD